MEIQINPFQFWKQVYDYAEQNYSEAIQKNMQEESFASWIGACQQWYLFCQDTQNKFLEQFFQMTKLAGKEDLAQVSSLVIQLEEKVEALDERIDEELLEELKAIRTMLEQIKATTS